MRSMGGASWRAVLLVAAILATSGCLDNDPTVIQGVRAPVPELLGFTAEVPFEGLSAWAVVQFVAPRSAWQEVDGRYRLAIGADHTGEGMKANASVVFAVEGDELRPLIVLDSLDWTLTQVAESPAPQTFLLAFAADGLEGTGTIRFGPRGEDTHVEASNSTGATVASSHGAILSLFTEANDIISRPERSHNVNRSDSREGGGPLTTGGSLMLSTEHALGRAGIHLASLVVGAAGPSPTGTYRLVSTIDDDTKETAGELSPNAGDQLSVKAYGEGRRSADEVELTWGTPQAFAFTELIVLSIPWSPSDMGLRLSREPSPPRASLTGGY